MVRAQTYTQRPRRDPVSDHRNPEIKPDRGAVNLLLLAFGYPGIGKHEPKAEHQRKGEEEEDDDG